MPPFCFVPTIRFIGQVALGIAASASIIALTKAACTVCVAIG
jgi:hypothetical protein